ncbi:porin [Pelistega suis]|uniref:porin n=1 Tax=Pelistega suis TaxID=1631957 RepID=UPI00211BBEB3|nr:porin [Pelistega suis]MCQ9329042.1 porin [Pelistega suis]
MKKTLLVAALATGFAGVAHAESSVTLYGIVDAGYGVTKQTLKENGVTTSKTSKLGVRGGVQNGNRWGLKGVEDLGNGTAAIFQLEGGFDPANGNLGQSKAGEIGKVFGRQAFVGLTGESWGTFTIGRQYNAADSFVAPIDPFGTGWRQAAATTTFGSGISTRYDSAIKYVSPDFGGFQFGVGLVHADDKVQDLVKVNRTKGTGVTVGAGYNNGPLQLGAGFDYLRAKKTTEIRATGVSTGTDNSIKSWSLGAAYDFDVVKLHLMYGQTNDGLIGGNEDFGLAHDSLVESAVWNKGGLRVKSWLAGLSAPVGENGKLLFSYQGNRVKNKEVALNGKRLNGHVWSLGYRQGLSKRTSVYAVASYGQAKFKDNLGNRSKLKSTDVAVGLTHRF